MTEEKILEKLAKIKAHAESARQIGSEEEAQAFAEMLQRLLLRYNLAMSDVEFERHEREEPIEQHRVDWQDVKVRKMRVAWIEHLAGIVARAHFCRIVVHSHSSVISLVGRISSVKVAEYMLVVLVRTIEKLSHDAAYRGFNGANPELRGKGFRAAYTAAFVQRLAERFDEERKSTEATSSTALVRLNKEDQAVKDWMKERMDNGMFKKSSIVRGARSDGNAEGWRQGRKAADDVNLKGKAVEHGAARRELR
jgi:hypothetical protein